MTEPCDLSAVEARRRIGARQLSPRELLASCRRRIEATNPALNAIIHPCLERAEGEAADAERAVLAGEPLGLLHGLPLAVKDLNHVGGLPTTFGSPLFADHVADADEDVVARMRAAGAIVVGKTNVPEHGFGATTDNPLFGTTNNPFDPGRSAGASSGGTAVALAAGMVPLAMGSDFAGSLRTPASFCGITGFRPSPGVVAQPRRPFAFSPFDVEGPMGRSAADCRLLLAAMAGQDARDPLSLPPDPSLRMPPQPLDLSRLRVAISEDLGFAPVSARVRRAFREKIAALAGIFSRLDAAAPDMTDAEETFTTLRGVGFVADFRPMYDDNPDAFGATITDELARAEQLTLDDIGRAEKRRTELLADAQTFFAAHDLLVTPAAAVGPFPHADHYPASIDGEDMGGYLRWEAIAWGVTLLANPAIVIPAGLGPDGLPMGLQLVGPARRDAWLLDVAHALELRLRSLPDLARPVPDLRRYGA